MCLVHCPSPQPKASRGSGALDKQQSNSKAPPDFLLPRGPPQQSSCSHRTTIRDELTALAFPPTCMQRNWNQDQLESSSVDLNGKNILNVNTFLPQNQATKL